MNSGQSARFAALVIVSASSVFAGETAVVGSDRVNVRGAASLSAEVVTQLGKGEAVEVLGLVPAVNAGKGEPTNWFKIQLPANTPVWVHSGFISSSNTVSGSKLNVRGGPGENYSVLARLMNGDTVSPIRQVDDWMEIHPPTNAIAYVAASYLQLSGEGTPEPVPAVGQAAQPAPDAGLGSSPKVEEKPALTEEQPVPKVEETPIARAEPIAPPVSEPPVEIPPPVVANPVPPVEAPPVVVAPAAPKRRIVVREGILRRDFHINTPGYFQLVDKYQGRLINYLYVSNKELDLGPFAGSVVIVRGEEYLDERWKRTPVIEVEHATLPN